MAARTSRPARSDDAKRELANARQRGVKRAWAQEKELVLQGKGTRDWTPEQQRELISAGRVTDIDGHHMKSASLYPQYADDRNNIQFLDSKDHIDGAHGGNTHTPTNGFYNPATGEMTDFGDSPPQPVEVIQLTEPVYVNGKEVEAQDKDAPEAEVEEETVTAEDALGTEEETDVEDETVTAEDALGTEEEPETAEEADSVEASLGSEGGIEDQIGDADGGHDGGNTEDNGGGIDVD